jgi:glycine cleavage system H protein
MSSPEDRRYSREHEWLKLGADVAIIGITDYAQEQLGDVVYVDLPETGAALTQFEKMGEIESVKAVSELYAPASGEVLEANEELVQSPQLVNSDPYGAGWLVRVRLADASQAGGLMSAQEYDDFTASEAADEAVGP